MHPRTVKISALLSRWWSKKKKSLTPAQERKSILLVFFIRPAVYILAGKQNGTIVIRVMSDYWEHVWEHTNSLVEGFTK